MINSLHPSRFFGLLFFVHFLSLPVLHWKVAGCVGGHPGYLGAIIEATGVGVLHIGVVERLIKTGQDSAGTAMIDDTITESFNAPSVTPRVTHTLRPRRQTST